MEAELGVGVCTCDPGPEGQHRYWCGPDNPHGEPTVDLTVKFQEPTVGGLTGTQLSLLREYDDAQRCWYEVFPVSPKGPAERCLEPRESWSSYCEEHAYQVAQEDPPEQDDYDCYVDRNYE